MPGNSFGHLFRVTTAGESHGPAYVCIIDGCPPGLPLGPEDLQPDLDRRRPGQSKYTSSRREPDVARILSGVFEGVTTGTSIAIVVDNADARSGDYDALRDVYRPGHADFTFDAKFGHRDHRGGGRSSARETVVRVAAGAVARKLLRVTHGVEVLGYVKQVGSVVAEVSDPTAVTLRDVESHAVRCPDPEAAERMGRLIEELRSERDSIGGLAEIVVQGVPPGWGEPVFGKLRAELGQALLSLPAVMGVEFGEGFGVVTRRGSEHNDPFCIDEQGRIKTSSNRHGGMLGGISSGMPLVIRCAVKPTSSLPREQQTVTRRGVPTTVTTRGRHDPCLLPRFVPMGEAMVALTLVDHMLRQRTLGAAGAQDPRSPRA